MALAALAGCGEPEGEGAPSDPPPGCLIDAACPARHRCVNELCEPCDGSETPYDGIDNDCDPSTKDADLDGDGENWDGAAGRPGTDCDDEDPLVRVGAQEVCGDGKDNDCNGTVDDLCNDLGPPVVSFLVPSPGGVMTGTVRVEVQATDDSGVASVTLAAEGQPLGTAEAEPWGFDVDTSLLGNGAHNLVATAIDLTGKIGTGSVAVVVDNGPPSVAFVRPVIGETRGGTLTVEVSATDPAGITSVAVLLDGVEVGTMFAEPYELELDTTELPDGPHTFTAIATDVTDRERQLELTVTVDNTAPVVSFTAPAAGSFVSSGIDVEVAATDPAGIDRILSEGQQGPGSPLGYRLDTSGRPEGPLTIEATAADSAVVDDLQRSGNTASVQLQLVVDRTAPILAVTAPAAGSLLSGVVEVLGTAADGAGVASLALLLDGVPTGATAVPAPGFLISWDTATAADGPHTLAVEAVDPAGNASRIELAVVLDNLPPTVSLVRPTAGPSRGGMITVEVLATDLVGVDRLDVLVDGVPVGTAAGAGPALSLAVDSRAFADGARSIQAVVHDGAGHSASVSTTVVVDNTLPAVSFSTPAAGANLNGQVAVRVEATDASGLASISSEGFTGAASPLDYSLDLDLSPEGALTLTATAVDGAVVDDGAGTNTGTATLALVVDRTSPTVTLAAPLADSVVFGTITVVAAASDANSIAQVELLVDGIPLDGPVLAPGPYQLPWDTTLAGDGLHDIRVNATDAAGNVGSFLAPVTVDNTGPVVTIASPGASDVRGGTMTLEATGEPLEIARVDLILDGVIVASPAAPPYSTVIDTTGYADGPHVLEAIGVDASGNSRTTSLTMTIDNTAPVVAFTIPAAGGTFGNGVNVQITATDASGILRIDSGGNSSAVSPLAYRYDLLTTPDGSLVLNATATDVAVRDDVAGAGNLASASVTIDVDNSPPVVAITAPASGDFLRGTVGVAASASDNRALARVRLFADALLLADVAAPGPYTASWNTAPAANGPHTLRAEATDSAGNVASTSIPVVVDTIGPTSCAVTVPAANALVAGLVDLTANGADGNGVVRIVFQVDGVGVAVGNGSPTTASWSSLGVADGSHSLVAVCHDAAGNSRNSAPVAFRVDNTAPLVVLTSPVDGEGVFRSTLLTATATDTNPVARVEFSVNGGTPIVDSTSPYSVTFDFTGLSGIAVVRAEGFDSRGNSGVALANVQVIPRAGFRIAELWAGTGTLGTAGFTVADVTGDGLPDLLIAGTELSLRRGTGTGFDPAVRIPGVTGVVAVATADLDGDGDRDLLALKAGSLESVLNLGAGTFSAPVSLALGAIQATDLSVGDVDGDGDLDVAISQQAAGSDVRVLLNNGAGTFSLASTLGTLGAATDVELADLEPDGDLDVVVGRTGAGNNKITVFRNDGSGAFAGGQDTTTPAPPEKLAVGDLDGSGGPELLVAMATVDAIAILTPTGPGNYSVGAALSTGDSPSGLTLGDFDGDGDRDAVVTCSVGNGFEVWTNAAGALGRTALYVSGRGSSRPMLVDVDGDLRLDLLHAAPTDAALALARGGGDGTFSAAPAFLLPDFLSDGNPVDRTPRAVAVGELRGGGGPDLALSVDAVSGAGAIPQEVWVLQNGGNNRFSPVASRDLQECVPPAATPNCLVNAECSAGFTCTGPAGAKLCCTGSFPQIVTLAVGDLDGQNEPDLAVGTAATTGSSAALLPSLPAGDLGIRTLFAVDIPKALDVVISDVNNDGVGEAIFSADGAFPFPDGAVIVDALGGRTSLASGEGAAGVLVADLDGDGDRDLAVANSVTDNVSVYLWDGVALGSPTLFSTVAGINALGFGLTAGDARGDLIGLGAGQAVLLAGDPAFTFGAPTTWATGASPTKLVVDDFNGDGLADALLLRPSANQAVLLIARPQGGFFAPDAISLPAVPNDLGLGDLDANGRPDVVVTATGSKQYTLLVNDL